MEQRHKPYPKGGYQGGQQRQHQAPFQGKPKKSGYAGPIKSPITVITNDFKIKSRSSQMIYTYSVDFIEGATGAGAGLAGKEKSVSEAEEVYSTVSGSTQGGLGGLETF